jgi:hypothetical protein
MLCLMTTRSANSKQKSSDPFCVAASCIFSMVINNTVFVNLIRYVQDPLIRRIPEIENDELINMFDIYIAYYIFLQLL